MSKERNEKLIRFVPVSGETVVVHAMTWRSDPPTVDEVRAWSWWWHRTRIRKDDTPFDISVIRLVIRDGAIFFAANGERFLLRGFEYAEWTPCLPPDDSFSKSVEPTDKPDNQEWKFAYNPPAHPTTLGDVWVGDTKPTPEVLKRFAAVELGSLTKGLDELQRLRAEAGELQTARQEIERQRQEIERLNAVVYQKYSEAVQHLNKIYPIAQAYENLTKELLAEITRLESRQFLPKL